MKPIEIGLTAVVALAIPLEMYLVFTSTGTLLEFGGIFLIALNAVCIYKLCEDRKKS